MMQKTANKTALKAIRSVFAPNCREFAVLRGGGVIVEFTHVRRAVALALVLVLTAFSAHAAETAISKPALTRARPCASAISTPHCRGVRCHAAIFNNVHRRETVAAAVDCKEQWSKPK